MYICKSCITQVKTVLCFICIGLHKYFYCLKIFRVYGWKKIKYLNRAPNTAYTKYDCHDTMKSIFIPREKFTL